jgi:hypothetical protein
VETAVQIMLGVPGPWRTSPDILTAIAGHSGSPILVGNHLFNPTTGEMSDVAV